MWSLVWSSKSTHTNGRRHYTNGHRKCRLWSPSSRCLMSLTVDVRFCFLVSDLGIHPTCAGLTPCDWMKTTRTSSILCNIITNMNEGIFFQSKRKHRHTHTENLYSTRKRREYDFRNFLSIFRSGGIKISVTWQKKSNSKIQSYNN